MHWSRFFTLLAATLLLTLIAIYTHRAGLAWVSGFCAFPAVMLGSFAWRALVDEALVRLAERMGWN